MGAIKNYFKTRSQIKLIAANIRTGQPVIANLDITRLDLGNSTGVHYYRINIDPKNKLEIRVSKVDHTRNK